MGFYTKAGVFRSQPEDTFHLSEYQVTAAVAGAAMILSLIIVLISCIRKRRNMDKRRRQKLVESLRSGGDSASESSVENTTAAGSCEPEGGEPEDIKELFYFYWRQGTSIAASRQAFSVELNSRVDEGVEEEKNGPRRQTVSGGCVDRRMPGKGARLFNPANLNELRQQRRCSANDAGRVDNRCDPCRHRSTVHHRGGNSDLGPSPESETFFSETSSVSGDDYAIKEPGKHGLTIPEEEGDNNGDVGADRRGTDVSANEQKITVDQTNHETTSNLGSETSTDLDLTRYVISSNERLTRRTLRRLNSCPESEMNSTIGERTWSFSSLLWTWDFKKSSVAHDVEFPDV